MWTARIFAGIVFAGIAFLLWFLVQLLREQPFRSHRIQLVRPADHAALNQLQLQSEWAAVKREADTVTLHSVWRYGVNYTTESEKGEPSCRISSSYL
jgi:hypothetical protein